MLSVSIVTYNIEEDDFFSMLLSLDKAILKLEQSEGSSVQTTIIDNGHQEALLLKIISRVEGEKGVGAGSYELISGHGNIGYGRANNLVIKTTKAKYHLILNPDVILAENCLVEGLNYLVAADASNGKAISAISPRATDDSGSIQYLCKRYPSAFNFLLRGFAPKKIQSLFRERLDYYELRDRIKADSSEVIENVPLISGCFMLCNTQFLQEVGGFNEKFFLHFEDLALSMELSKLGNLDYVPNMKIQHFGGNSARRGIKHIFIFICSGLKFFNLYGWKFI